MRTTKRLLALLLSLIMVIACALPASAASGKEPLIIVNGMGESPLLMNQGTEDQYEPWPPSTDDIVDTVFQVLPMLLKLPFNRSAFGDSAYPVLRDLFDDIVYNPDGTSKHNVGQLRFPDSYANDKTGKINSVSHGRLAKLYGEEYSYQFVIDWRESAVAEAERLNQFVEKVCKETGCSTVKIMAVSMGGGVAMAYVAKYGHDRISTLVLMHSVFQGLPIVGDLFNKRVTLDGKSLQIFVKRMLAGNEPWLSIVALLLGTLRVSGTLDYVLDRVEALEKYLEPEIYDEMITPVFAQLPGFWGLVSDADYESGKALLLDEKIHAGLIEKIDDYHYNVFNKAEQLLDAAMKDGVNCYVLSGYNQIGVPIGTSALVHTDDGLATPNTSGGATCALLGETLGDGYKQAVKCGHNHIDPDNMIDASTCFLPEQTWFQKDLGHASFFSDDSLNFLLWLVESEKRLSVHTTAKYPQFMKYDGETGALTAF